MHKKQKNLISSFNLILGLELGYSNDTDSTILDFSSDSYLQKKTRSKIKIGKEIYTYVLIF